MLENTHVTVRMILLSSIKLTVKNVVQIKMAMQEVRPLHLGWKVRPIGPGWSNTCVFSPSQSSTCVLKKVAIWPFG